MEITYYIDNKVMVVALVGELDEYASTTAKRQLDKIIDNVNYNSVIFDFSRLSFMDSTGIGVLLGRYKLLISKNIPSYVYNPSRTVDKILAMSGIYSIMPKVNSVRRK